jgi:hypothetical protein
MTVFHVDEYALITPGRRPNKKYRKFHSLYLTLDVVGANKPYSSKEDLLDRLEQLDIALRKTENNCSNVDRTAYLEAEVGPHNRHYLVVWIECRKGNYQVYRGPLDSVLRAHLKIDLDQLEEEEWGTTFKKLKLEHEDWTYLGEAAAADDEGIAANAGGDDIAADDDSNADEQPEFDGDGNGDQPVGNTAQPTAEQLNKHIRFDEEGDESTAVQFDWNAMTKQAAAVASGDSSHDESDPDTAGYDYEPNMEGMDEHIDATATAIVTASVMPRRRLCDIVYDHSAYRNLPEGPHDVININTYITENRINIKLLD